MKNSVTTFQETGSFVAGLLIGLSIAIPVSAMSMTQPTDWQILWVLCGVIIFALGVILQLLVTTKPWPRPTIPEPLVLPAEFIGSSYSV